MGLRYEGLRMRKAMMSDPMSVEMMAKTRATLSFTPRDDMPPELVPDPDLANVKPAKAPQMRKLIDAAFKELFAPKKRKLPRGIDRLHRRSRGQRDYGVDRLCRDGNAASTTESASRMQRRGSPLARLTYENLWGAGQDGTTSPRRTQRASMRLLGELVARVVRLRNSVMDVIGEDSGDV